MMTLTRWGLGLAALASLVAIEPRAEAKDRPANTARAHFDRGLAYVHLERWREALAEFEAGYVDKPDPLFLYQVAECHRRLGNEPEAVRKYRSYLEETDPKAKRPSDKSTHESRSWERWRKSKEPKRAEVEKTLTALEAMARAQGPAVAPPTAPVPAPLPAAVAAAPSPSLPPTPPPAPAPPSDSSGDSSGLLVPKLASDDPAAEPTAPRPAPSLRELPPLIAASPTQADEDREGAPVYKKWWFWTAIGAAVAAGTVTVFLMSGSKDPSCPDGYSCRSAR